MSTAATPSVPGSGSGPPPMVRLSGLSLRYGQREALSQLNLEVAPGERFALLGPNGSGKSTLLRILSTLLRPTAGSAAIDGYDIAASPGAVRNRLGVVFQRPGLDDKLSIAENLRFQGYLFGLSGRPLSIRIDDLLERFGLAQRRREKVETLSGGLKRRVELAKSLLHRPAVLLLDEPSTGLDLAARQVFWQTLDDLHGDDGLTIVVATHLMDEADGCDRVALLDAGRLVALDAPDALKAELGETMIVIETPRPNDLGRRLSAGMGLDAKVLNGRLHLTPNHDAELVPRLMTEAGSEITSLTLGRPTLDDVFLARTGHTIVSDAVDAGAAGTEGAP